MNNKFLLLTIIFFQLTLSSISFAGGEKMKRIIYNNDGGDAYILNSEALNLSKEERIEKFLSARTKPLVGTKITTIFYCTGTLGLSLHNSKISSIIQHIDETRWATDKEKISQMVENRIDPLSIIVDFCKKNKLEVFWSLRMNDVHDSGNDEGSKFLFKMNRFKQLHPEYLLGSNPWPTFGRTTAFDYSNEEVRELAFRMVEEVCNNYDIDGVHLDFFRHPVFFREVAFGLHATQEQLDAMTELIARIKNMMKKVEKKKGHRLLLAIRVPDSLEYCKVIGLDVETWLKKGYVDILIVGGYLQFNFWEYSIELGHKYKTQVCVDLSDTRVDIERASPESYRARAYTAWKAGADGLHIFNFFNFKKENIDLLNETADPVKLSTLNKVYFPNVMASTRIAWAGYPCIGYINIPTVSPIRPLEIKIAENTFIKMMIYDRFDVHRRDVECNLEILVNDIQDLKQKLKENFVIFFLNNKNLENLEEITDVELRKEKIKVIRFDIPSNMIKPGLNQIEVVNRGENLLKLYDVRLYVNYKKGKR